MNIRLQISRAVAVKRFVFVSEGVWGNWPYVSREAGVQYAVAGDWGWRMEILLVLKQVL